MIRGTQKKMIVVKTTDSLCFEEAYFVVRRECSAGGGDMVNEANRMIARIEGEKKGRYDSKKGGLRSLALFLCGCGAGAIVTALITLVV